MKRLPKNAGKIFLRWAPVLRRNPKKAILMAVLIGAAWYFGLEVDPDDVSDAAEPEIGPVPAWELEE